MPRPERMSGFFVPIPLKLVGWSECTGRISGPASTDYSHLSNFILTSFDLKKRLEFMSESKAKVAVMSSATYSFSPAKA